MTRGMLCSRCEYLCNQDRVKCRRGGFAKVNNAPDARRKTLELAREDNSGTKPSRNSGKTLSCLGA